MIDIDINEINIVRYYNKKNCDKRMFIPLYIDMMNYFTIQ